MWNKISSYVEQKWTDVEYDSSTWNSVDFIFVIRWNKKATCGINIIDVELCGIVSAYVLPHIEWNEDF